MRGKESSTALHPHSPPTHKRRIRLSPARNAFPRTVPLVRRFLEDLTQHCLKHPNDCHPCSSASRVGTKGLSVVASVLAPDRAPTHCRSDSISSNATITMRTPVTAASRRLLKTSLALPSVAA